MDVQKKSKFSQAMDKRVRWIDPGREKEEKVLCKEKRKNVDFNELGKLVKEEIIKRYYDGESIWELNKIYGLKNSTLKPFLVRTKERNYRNRVIDANEIVKNYTNGASITLISKLHHKAYPAIRKVLVENNVISNRRKMPEKENKLDGTKVICADQEQTFKESLRWAMDSAGLYLRTNVLPAICPCNTAWYLFLQAVESPRDFMSKVSQVESKGNNGEDTGIRKESTKSIAELDEFLTGLINTQDVEQNKVILNEEKTQTEEIGNSG
jgi:hypothetical protein